MDFLLPKAALVRRRRVFHIGGYHPASPAAARRHFERELRRFESTWSATARVAGIDGEPEAWRIVTSGANWRVETEFRLLRWDDIIEDAGRRSMWWRVPCGLLAFLDFAAGALWRYLRANWRYALFFLYPFLLFALFVATAWFVGNLAADVTGLPLLGAGLGSALFAILLHWPGRKLYLPLLFDDWIFSRHYVRRPHWELEPRLDRMARAIAEASNENDLDEIVVIGHSLGAVLAIDVLDRALMLAPRLGQDGPRVALVSIGSSILKIGLHTGAKRFRAAVARVAAPGIFWADYQALSDVMNFYKSDPIGAMGLTASNPPVVRVVRIKHMLDPAIYARMRYNPLRMHSQFVSGNNKRASYDYFMLVCGPLPAEWQTRSGDGAVSAFAADGALFEAGNGSATPGRI